MDNPVIGKRVAFDTFLNSYKETLKKVFDKKETMDLLVHKRGFPPRVLSEIMAANPLSVVIPSEYGGRGGGTRECLGIMDASSYESLPLSLTMGINLALFLSPVSKYANKDVKEDIFNRFLTRQNMGGLMITEPNFGSDALGMQTSNYKSGSEYILNGTKHWQGLTGMADYWLITSREKLENGSLGRDIDFFICDVQEPQQRIHVEEIYNNVGLYPIPYGKNIVDIRVPEQYKLEAESTGLKLMLDLLHRSRMHFPGMGIGFIRRMLDEAIQHCNQRFVGGKPLIDLDQVKHQISRIQSAFTISSAMCLRSSAESGIEKDLSGSSVEANSMKAYVTDMMQESAQILTQVSGGNGYKAESMGSRGMLDSRPFQIFEGSNEMLYTQISDSVIKMMSRIKEVNLSSFFMKYDLTKNVAAHFKSTLNFNVDVKTPQRKLIDLGKIISRVISMNHLEEMGNKGFRKDLIKSSIETIKHEIAMLVASYQYQINVAPIEEYKEDGNWLSINPERF
jgi:alkylation response protein AidB-like acyl-CoA dehydrogenase